MAFVQATTGAGGWPMSVWLTPDAGAVLRRHLLSAGGAPGAGPASATSSVRSRAAWRDDRAEGHGLGAARPGQARRPQERTAATVAVARQPRARGRRGRSARRRSTAAWRLRRRAEVSAARASCCSCCGSMRAPVRPTPRVMVLGTLRAMALGGMRDHIGGGFHRYSVDARLARAALREDALRPGAARAGVSRSRAGDRRRLLRAGRRGHARATSNASCCDPRAASIRPRTPTAMPPDAAGQPGARATEGAFYIWSRDGDRRGARSRQPRVVERALRRAAGGNAPFDPAAGVRRQQPALHRRDLAAIASRIRAARSPMSAWPWHVRGSGCSRRASSGPGRSSTTRCVTAWNGLMIAACARAGRVLAPGDALGEGVGGTGAVHLKAAQRCAAFVRDRLWNRDSGRLLRRWAAGAAGIDAFAEDYACLVWGLIELFQCDGDPQWLAWAVRLQRDARRALCGRGRPRLVQPRPARTRRCCCGRSRSTTAPSRPRRRWR